MANSRYDDIRYYSNGSFNIPKQIKVYDGSSWVDLGEKNSFNTKKFNTRYNNNFICATYYRHDVDIPKTVQVGKINNVSKYIELRYSDGHPLPVDTYNAGYAVDMWVQVNSTTPLYTVYKRNSGDIVNQAYTNYVAEVSGNSVRIRVTSNFSGYRIQDGKYADKTSTDYTSYCFAKGEKVRVYLYRSSAGGQIRVRVYNQSGTLLTDKSMWEQMIQSWSPDYHRLGSETADNSGRQSVYGNANIHSFSMNHPNMSVTFTTNFNNSTNGATDIWSTSTMGGYAHTVNTSVYGAKYTEYIKQTI